MSSEETIEYPPKEEDMARDEKEKGDTPPPPPPLPPHIINQRGIIHPGSAAGERRGVGEFLLQGTDSWWTKWVSQWRKHQKHSWRKQQ